MKQNLIIALSPLLRALAMSRRLPLFTVCVVFSFLHAAAADEVITGSFTLTEKDGIMDHMVEECLQIHHHGTDEYYDCIVGKPCRLVETICGDDSDLGVFCRGGRWVKISCSQFDEAEAFKEFYRQQRGRANKKFLREKRERQARQ